MSFESGEEVEKMARSYLKRYHKKHNKVNPEAPLEEFLKKEIPILME